MICAPDSRGGLYILNHPQVTISNTLSHNDDSCTKNLFLKYYTYVNSVNHNHCIIWHLRFGQQSFEKLIEIKKYFLFVQIMQ